MARLVPELDRSGPDETLKQGDDFTGAVKARLGDFLKSQVDDPDVGKKNSDDRVFAEEGELEHLTNTQWGDGGPSTTFFGQLSPSEYGDLREVIDDNIESGIGQEDILAAVEGFAGGETPADDQAAQDSPAAGTVVGAVSRVLAQNRFTPTSTYGEQFDDDGIISTMPTALGRFDPDGAPARLEDLKKVGISLMLKATGEFIEGDPTNPGVSLGSLIPGQAQLGVTIDARNLEAANAFGAPGEGGGTGPLRSRVLDVLSGRSPRSFGQLNSCNEPFDGFMPLGMTGLAIVLVVALRLLTTGFVRLIGLIAGKPFGLTGGQLSSDPLTMGQWGKVVTNNPLIPIRLQDIGIIQLDRDFVASVDEGLRVFFSFEGEDFGRIARSPGFYANMVRTIVQSGGRVVRDVADAFKKIAGGNVVAGVQSTLGIIDVLRTSKVIAFLNIMAILGDRSFALRESGVDRAPRGSIIDAIPDNATSRIMKSRVTSPEGGTTLAWRNSAPVSAMVLPGSIKSAASTLLGSFSAYEGALSTLEKDAVDNGTEDRGRSRLTFQQVEEVERQLDAEYVPFYFQDLRTNEIVSFHAFMNAVNESFSPVYGETQPYGRIDPVMTYASTRREFSLTFHVVSTSPRDFDLMYVKVNKLGTLLYPQWTKGRTVVDEQGRPFVQPFSQVPAASPLCRIRLGNIIKSNFSNIALARLFGLGSDDFLGVERDEPQSPADFDAAFNSLKRQIDATGHPVGSLVTMHAIGLKHVNDRLDSSLLGVTAGPSDQGQTAALKRAIERSSLVRVVSPPVQKTTYQGVETRVYTVEFTEPGLEGVRVTVPEAAVSISVAEVERRVTGALPGVDTPMSAPEDEKSLFFDPVNNAVVRSFRNVQGKGLAGFITSLNIDWNEADGNWDVERFHARAPQLLKIDLNFTVVHDIPPGIDHEGFNRAPIYPVGEVMGRSYGDVYDTLGTGEARFKELFGKLKGG